MGRSRSRIAAACLAGALSLTLISAARATDPTAKWCEGVRIAAFPGGPQGGVFANNVYNGFRQAELDLGPKVTYYFSNWDPNTMLTQIKQARATKVDGIATYGFGGDPATDPLVDQTSRRGTSSPRSTPRSLTPRGNIPRKGSASSARRTTTRATRWPRRRSSEPG